jgi:hypothetical protein
MPNKKTEKKPEEKRYTYEEYRRAFCGASEPELEIADPKAFGIQLAREALKKIERPPRKK